jgi:hypothetical protein
MPPFDDLIGWFFKLMIAGLMSFFWWGKREDKKILSSHSEAIVKLSTQMVTEDKVREIVTEVTAIAMSPVADALAEIKRVVIENSVLTKELQIKMATQDGYNLAVKELQK